MMPGEIPSIEELSPSHYEILSEVGVQTVDELVREHSKLLRLLRLYFYKLDKMKRVHHFGGVRARVVGRHLKELEKRLREYNE